MCGFRIAREIQKVQNCKMTFYAIGREANLIPLRIHLLLIPAFTYSDLHYV